MSTPDRSIEPTTQQDASFSFGTDVELAAPDTMPVSVWVDVDGADMVVTLMSNGSQLNESDVVPEDWRRLCAKAGVA